MTRDLQAEKDAFEERIAICVADGIPEADAIRIADIQLWQTIRASEERACTLSRTGAKFPIR